jgi:hypothetical protein
LKNRTCQTFVVATAKTRELKDEQADAASTPPLMAGQSMSSSDAPIDLLVDQNDNDDDSDGTEITDGAKFVIKGTDKLSCLISHRHSTRSTTCQKMTRTEACCLTQKETRDTIEATDDNPTQNIEEKVKETEQLFDKAVQEIHDVHLHAPKLQRPESYEDCNFETLAAQATHNYVEEKGVDVEIKWEEKRRDSDRNWNQKREAIKQQCQETLDEQASIQASLATQETDRVRQEHQQIKQEIAATSDDVRNQNKSQTRALGRLKTMVAEIKTMKQELRDDTNALTQLKISTREETAQINETMKEARQIQQALQQDVEDARRTQKTLQNNVEHTVKATIQKVVDSQMVKVERAIKDTLQKRGQLLVHQAKLDMAEQFGNQ